MKPLDEIREEFQKIYCENYCLHEMRYKDESCRVCMQEFRLLGLNLPEVLQLVYYLNAHDNFSSDMNKNSHPKDILKIFGKLKCFVEEHSILVNAQVP